MQNPERHNKEPERLEPETRNPEAEPWNGRVHLERSARTPCLLVFAIGAALYGLVASGIGLFNESIPAERGLGPNIYYQTLVVTAMTGLAGNFCGRLASRVSCRSTG